MLRSKGVMKKIFAILGAILSAIYLLNPTAGFIEFIPDTIPGVGNIDEALMAAILVASLKSLGIDPLRMFGDKDKSEDKNDIVDVD